MNKNNRRCKYCNGPHPVSDYVAEESPFCANCLHERVAKASNEIENEMSLLPNKNKNNQRTIDRLQKTSLLQGFGLGKLQEQLNEAIKLLKNIRENESWTLDKVNREIDNFINKTKAETESFIKNITTSDNEEKETDNVWVVDVLAGNNNWLFWTAHNFFEEAEKECLILKNEREWDTRIRLFTKTSVEITSAESPVKASSEPAITYTTDKTKPIEEVKVSDVPRGLSADDVACEYNYPGLDDDGEWESYRCGKPATHLSCSPIINQPVCAEHKCRCNKLINCSSQDSTKADPPTLMAIIRASERANKNHYFSYNEFLWALKDEFHKASK